MKESEFTGSAMPPTLQQLGVDKLSVLDRFALAQALWDSVHDSLNDEVELSPELKAELTRRAALSDADPTRGTPWEQVRDAARARWYP